MAGSETKDTRRDPGPTEVDFGAPSVLVERRGAVVVVTLNRPDRRNALSQELFATLVSRMTEVDADPEVRVIVLTGGTELFAAGSDVRLLADTAAWQLVTSERRAGWERLHGLRTVTVAAIAGHVLGGGCELALIADMIVAGDSAVLGQPEIRLGLMPGAGGSQRWPRTVGRARAAEVVLAGRTVDAWEALELGLVNRVVPRECTVSAAIELAEELAAHAPIALRLAKEGLGLAAELPLSAGLAQERALMAAVLSTADSGEGISAFLERRAPRFEGR